MNVRYSKMFYDNPTSRAYKIIVTSNYKVIAAVLDFLNLEISVYCFYHVLLLITVLWILEVAIIYIRHTGN